MNKYVITLDPGTTGVPSFSYHFSMVSDESAIDYTVRLTRAYFVNIPWLAAAQLFDLDKGHVATFYPHRHVAVTISRPDPSKQLENKS